MAPGNVVGTGCSKPHAYTSLFVLQRCGGVRVPVCMVPNLGASSPCYLYDTGGRHPIHQHRMQKGQHELQHVPSLHELPRCQHLQYYGVERRAVCGTELGRTLNGGGWRACVNSCLRLCRGLCHTWSLAALPWTRPWQRLTIDPGRRNGLEHPNMTSSR